MERADRVMVGHKDDGKPEQPGAGLPFPLKPHHRGGGPLTAQNEQRKRFGHQQQASSRVFTGVRRSGLRHLDVGLASGAAGLAAGGAYERLRRAACAVQPGAAAL